MKESGEPILPTEPQVPEGEKKEEKREEFIKKLDKLAEDNENELKEIDEYDRDAIGDCIRGYEEKKRKLWEEYEKEKKDLGKEIPFNEVSIEINYSILPDVDESELKKFLFEFVEGINCIYHEGDKLIWNNRGDIELVDEDDKHIYAWSHDNILRKFIMDYLGIEEKKEEEK